MLFVRILSMKTDTLNAIAIILLSKINRLNNISKIEIIN